jgi:opacity protein-like surface antigen
MKRVWCGVCVVSCLAVAASAKAADGGKLEVSGGYSSLRDQGASQNMPSGWVASGLASINRWFGVVGEVGGSYRTPAVPGDGMNVHTYAFLGGPRYTVRPGARVSVFGQALVGAARLSSGINGDSSRTDLAFQPGGGIDVAVTRRWGVRFEGDFRAIRESGTMIKQERFVAGFVFRP